MTQTQIADQVGISQMHVSRLLAQTLAQLRRPMMAANEAMHQPDAPVLERRPAGALVDRRRGTRSAPSKRVEGDRRALKRFIESRGHEQGGARRRERAPQTGHGQR